MKKILLLLLTLAMLAFVGCKEEEKNVAVNELNQELENTSNTSTEETEGAGGEEVSTKVYVDSNGREVEVSSKPERVIALYASFGDLWFEAGGELVGINDASTIPEKAADLPKLGKTSSINVEAVLALEPDFIIMRAGYAKQEDLLPIFEENNITVFFADYNNFEETMEIFEIFCEINENASLYEEKGLSMISSIEEIIKEKLDFSYLLLFASSRSISAKDSNIAANIINGFGGDNIASTHQIANEESKQFSFEKILELDPKFIFVQTMGDVDAVKERLEKDITSNPAWGSLTAVKEGRFIYLPKELFLYKPNMKYVEAYEYIQNLLEVIK